MISSRSLQNMPNPQQLRRLLQSLAVLDAILSPDWEYRYYSYDSAWSEDSEMGSMRNGSGDHFFALFKPAGVGIIGLAHESPMFRVGEPWPGLFDGLPAALADLRTEPAFDSVNCSFCIWHAAGDKAWKRGPVEMAPGDDPDGSAELFRLLDQDPAGYARFAAEYYETDVPIESVVAIYEHRPLSPELISTLNKNASLAELRSDLGGIGYP